MHLNRFSHSLRLLILALASWTILSPRLHAEVWLSAVFGNHMVLQQEKPIIVWGWAQPNETVTLLLGAEKAQVQANERGEWKTELPAMKAGGPYTLTVSGSSRVQFEDVMVGEVWLCSGQSNMEMGIGMVRNGQQEIANANYPGVRLLMVPNRWTPQPQTNLDAVWKVCTPQSVAEGGWNGFSAAGYFFGRELNQKLGVTVGLIDATWGGTRIESWTPPEGFASVTSLRRDYETVELGDPRSNLHRECLNNFLSRTEHWLASARQASTNKTLVPPMEAFPAELQPPHEVQNATALYNGMIHPLCPFGLRGAIWYQGEANCDEGMLYAERMKALVSGWRRIWGEGDFPFYFVQIAPYNYGGRAERLGEFWEAQATAGRVISNAGMVVVNDIGNLSDIHPTNKQEVGRRLALWALAKAYHQSELLCSGPTFKSLSLEGEKLRVTFDQVGTGLISRDGKPLSWFEIIDADEGGFVPAEAKIDGATVVLCAPSVKRPVAMRFAWSMLAEPNLANSAGLPAGTFRAGDVPKFDALARYVPEAKSYHVVYDLDLSKLGPSINWDQDNRASIHQPIDRIAYLLELQGAGGPPQFVYVSMDAFTDSLDRIGIPTLVCGARFQCNVNHMNVFSNVKGIFTGTNLAGGNIEFWPDNYITANDAHVPNASSDVFDFGDEPNAPADGYGSMQIHNHDAKQTLFAINHWREGSRADLGIGSQPSGNPDWTFAANAASYSAKRLRILVHCN